MMSFESSFGGQPSAPDDRATEFKAVEGTTGEQYNGYTLMVEAYAAIWLVLMGWLVLLWRKQADMNARIDGLEGAIARAERNAAAKSKPKDTNGSEKKKETEKST
jgi:CcmD family protein